MRLINAKEAAELAANNNYIKEALHLADLQIRNAAEKGKTVDDMHMTRDASQWAVDYVIKQLQYAGYSAWELPTPEEYKGTETTWSYWRYIRISWENPKEVNDDQL